MGDADRHRDRSPSICTRTARVRRLQTAAAPSEPAARSSASSCLAFDVSQPIRTPSSHPARASDSSSDRRSLDAPRRGQLDAADRDAARWVIAQTPSGITCESLMQQAAAHARLEAIAAARRLGLLAPSGLEPPREPQPPALALAGVGARDRREHDVRRRDPGRQHGRLRRQLLRESRGGRRDRVRDVDDQRDAQRVPAARPRRG